MKTLKYYYCDITQIIFFKQNGLKAAHFIQLSEINNNKHLNYVKNFNI